MDMKKLLTIVSGKEKQQINESTIECNGMPSIQGQPTTPPVTMNINMNAQGVDQIKELIKLVNGGDQSMTIPTSITPAPAAPQAASEMPPQAEPEADDSELSDIMKLAGQEKEQEAFANEPEELLGDINLAVADGDDLHRSKQQFRKAQDGDNPMAAEGIRAQLDKLYQQIKEGKKSKPDFLDVDKDGNKKEPMKKALKDKKKGKTDEAIDTNLIKAAQKHSAEHPTKKDPESERNIHKKYGYRTDDGKDDDEDDLDDKDSSKKKLKKTTK